MDSGSLPNVTALAMSSATDPEAGQSSAILAAPHGESPLSWLAMFGRALLLMARVIPGILYWIMAFSTITLPTVLFTLFSTSLTFTMNFTTLYVRSRCHWLQGTNHPQDAHCASLCVAGLMAGKVPLLEHVRPVTIGTPAKRAADRFVPRHPRRLQAGAGQLPRRVLERNQGVWIS